MQTPSVRLAGTLLVLGLLAGPAAANSNMFCGGAAKGGDPSDLANVVGDFGGGLVGAAVGGSEVLFELRGIAQDGMQRAAEDAAQLIEPGQGSAITT